MTTDISTRDLLRESMWRSWQPPERTTWRTTGREELIEAFSRWCAANWKIPIPEQGMQKFVLRDYQKAILRTWLTNRRSICCKARQLGITTLAAAWMYYRAVFLEEEDIVAISRNEKEAAKILVRSKKGHKALPRWVAERLPALTKDNNEVMEFANGSKIESVPSQSDPARGMTLTWCYLDEAASLTDLADALSAVLPATRVGGMTMVGTAKNAEDVFANTCRAADEGTSEFKLIFLPWQSLYTKAEYELERRSQVDPHLFRREYPATLEEALQGAGNVVFDPDVLGALEASVPTSYELVANSLIEVEGGRLAIWHKPDPDCDYVLSVDPAEGLAHGDFTVAFVIEAKTGDIVAQWRGKPDIGDLAITIVDLAKLYGGALIVPERNNHGGALIMDLKRLKYRRIYRQKRLNGIKTAEATETLGWYTGSTNKGYLIENLKKWLRDHNVPDHQTIRELRIYQRNDKGQTGAPKGSHDDCVMALAIGIEGLNDIHLKEYAKEETVPEGTYAWYMQQVKAKKAARDRAERFDVLGRGNTRTDW